MYSIAFLNEKGGVGKTTSVYNVGYSLANMGKKVLMIDFDSQASLTVATGWELTQTTEHNLGNVLTGEEELADCIFTKVLPSNQDEFKLDIIPSHNSMGLLIQQEFNADSLTNAMTDMISLAEQLCGYDYVLIDCPPTMSVLLITSLMISDGVIVPSNAASYLSLVSLENTLHDLEQIQELRGGKPEFLGVIATQFKKNIRNHIEMTKMYRENFRLLGMIDDTNAFVTALNDGLPIKLLPVSNKQSRAAAREYEQVAEFIVNHIEYSDGKPLKNKKK